MKIGLYFGSFNPIHIGHLIIAEFVANNTEVDQVWLVVSPQNPLKTQATLLNEYHRLNLARIAVDSNPRLLVSNIEFKLPKPSYTIDTLTFLNEKYPEHTFSIIMGSDSYENLPKWKNAKQIQDNYKIIIYERPGFPVGASHQDHLIVKAPLLDISSTQIRVMISRKKSVRYMIPEEVRLEIENQGFYRELKKPSK